MIHLVINRSEAKINLLRVILKKKEGKKRDDKKRKQRKEKRKRKMIRDLIILSISACDHAIKSQIFIPSCMTNTLQFTLFSNTSMVVTLC